MCLFPEIPRSGAGVAVVQYSEFIAAMMERAVCLKEPLLRKAFAVLDQDNDGFITALDLELLLEQTSATSRAGAWRAVVAEADFDGAGLLTWENFLHTMLGTTPDLGQSTDLLEDCSPSSSLRESVRALAVLQRQAALQNHL